MTGTRILVLSDLHQNDGGRPFDPACIDAPFDVAVVAGDCAGRLTSSIEWLADRFGGVRVIYVPGNHDFYRDGTGDGFTIEDETEAGSELADRRGIDLLMDRAIAFGGLRFLGSVLWTDLRAATRGGPPQSLAEARRGMNDYRRIHRRSSSRRSRRIEPDFTRNLHRASLRFLEESFSVGDATRTVVVTHHAPSLRSLSQNDADLSQCYASDLDLRIRRWGPACWIHGHIHSASDYFVGTTRVVCNPLGRSGEATGFEPASIVTID